MKQWPRGLQLRSFGEKPHTYSINLSHEHVFVPIRGGRDRSSSQLSLFPEGIPSGNFNIAIENGH